MIPQWVIEKKRDKLELSESEIREFIQRYSDGDIPDYQMAAMAMAIYLNGMSFQETAWLTDAMMRSGDLLDTSHISLPKADKHSTGGIGDKVSLVLAPLIACCDIAVPMISGRGLGITGGTLDKMEAIPGYRVGLTEAEFFKVLDAHNVSMIGQTAEVAPADKKLYALRDVTATVPSIPLITGSIMCKKLAEGIDALILDVKWGSGAFMKSKDDARELAKTMVEVGTRMGKQVRAVLSDMNQPLGRTAGNAVEVVEAIESLQGNGPDDFMEVTLALCVHMLLMTNKAASEEEAHAILQAHIDSGAALQKFKDMVAAHGGDISVIDDPNKLPQAGKIIDLPAETAGTIQQVDANLIGRGVLLLGAGRQKTTDDVDHAVGITQLVKIGESVKAGDTLVRIHANPGSSLEEATDLFSQGIDVSSGTVSPPPLINEVILPEAQGTPS